MGVILLRIVISSVTFIFKAKTRQYGTNLHFSQRDKISMSLNQCWHMFQKSVVFKITKQNREFMLCRKGYLPLMGLVFKARSFRDNTKMRGIQLFVLLDIT